MMEQTIIDAAIGRITHMELCFDTLLEADPTTVWENSSLRTLLECLIQYYENGQWLHDYELDEQGLLPSELKRGILAQDAIYNFLEQAGKVGMQDG